jgi:hypothetical protein
MDGAPAALQAYEENRRDKTSKIVMANRDQPPDYLVEKVDQLTNGEPFRRIQDVIDSAELVAISDQYKEIAGYTLDINE